MDIELSLKKQAGSVLDAAKSQFGGILVLIAVLWGVFLASYIPYLDVNRWFALYPRQMTGALGIATMPLVHGSLVHIVSNTIPLVVMLLTLVTLQPKRWVHVVALITLISGGLTWLLASSNQQIVGASALVLGLVTFLIAPGFFVVAWWLWNRFRATSQPYPFSIRLVPLVVSAVIGFFCLDNIFFNLVPVFPSMGGQSVSYTAHWCGAAAGFIVAFLFAREETAVSTPSPVEIS